MTADLVKEITPPCSPPPGHLIFGNVGPGFLGDQDLWVISMRAPTHHGKRCGWTQILVRKIVIEVTNKRWRQLWVCLSGWSRECIVTIKKL